MRMDEYPKIMTPVVWLYGWSLGLLLYLGIFFLKLTCRVQIENAHRLNEFPSHILALWHEYWICYSVVVRFRGHHVWMTHPNLYMKPIQIFFTLNGVKEWVMGSKGEEGKNAVNTVAQKLKEGARTVIAVDGPTGPPHIAKKGAFYLSAGSGRPLLPIRCECKWSFPLTFEWDRKRIPLPFAKIKVTVSEPLFCHDKDINQAMNQLTTQLG